MDTVEELFPSFDEKGKELVRAAYSIAEKALEQQTRGNGKPFIEHPVRVAKIAADEIGLPAECIAAVFLHEATRFHPETDIPAGGVFGKDVLTMVDGLNKISTIKPKDTRLEAENYKKLIVSYSKDPRVTVLKLADRLEVMRSLDMFPKLSRERKILETLMLYIPLAHQLGLYNMKSEMEDTYFRYAEPEQYRAITNQDEDRLFHMEEDAEAESAFRRGLRRVRHKVHHRLRCRQGNRARSVLEGILICHGGIRTRHEKAARLDIQSEA